MTVGESIQKYRKELGLSQEELGQRLLVSRQTISLWEKDQTVPTIDNLIRLKETFGVSADALLGFENSSPVEEVKSEETLKYNFTQTELNEIKSYQRKAIYKKPFLFVLILSLFIIFLIAISAPNGFIAFYTGMLVIGAVSHIKALRLYHKTWKNNAARICESTYEYMIFKDYMLIFIYRNGEEVRKFKYYFTETEQIKQLGNWLLVQFAGQAYIIRKSDLKVDSSFNSYINKRQFNAPENMVPSKWKVISLILFIASLASIFGALTAVAVATGINNAFAENMWLFFLFTPITVASVIFGFFLKKKGGKYKKNVIVGIIMTVFLCVYGSFSFIFANVYSHSDEPIVKVENELQIDIPAPSRINTLNYETPTQSSTRGDIYYTSDIYFDEDSVKSFEEQLSTDVKWISSAPNDMIGITSYLYDLKDFDHFILYNIQTKEFNKIPSESGTYRFINVFYNSKNNTMKLVEYDIEYIK